jgi:hypothetical protein
LLPAQTTLAGVVRDSATGAPIPHAEILINIMNRREVADAEGRFTMFTLPSGRHLVLVRAIGYRAVGVPVQIALRGTTRVEFVLSSEAVELDSVIVTERPSMRGIGIGVEGFEERRRTRPFGIFIDSTRLRRNEVLDLTSTLRQAGVEVSGGVAVGRRTMRSLRRGSTHCPLAIYLDGIRVDMSLRDLTVSSVQAMEVYRSVAQIPPQYDRLDQECGVMLIWTRR